MEAESRTSRSCEEAVKTGEATEGNWEKWRGGGREGVGCGYDAAVNKGSGEAKRCVNGVNTGDGPGEAVEADGRGENRSHSEGVAGKSLSWWEDVKSRCETLMHRAWRAGGGVEEEEFEGRG